jgi:hypothetical protein
MIYKTIEQMKLTVEVGMNLFDDIALKRGLEVWRKIDGYYNYSVSTKGRVRNDKSGKLLKQCLDKDGYYKLTLYQDGKQIQHKIRRLVANSFTNNPENKKCVDHINNCRTDNNIGNLRWVTLTENQYNCAISNNNTSGVKGVDFHKKTDMWRAYIYINRKFISIGQYNTLKEAKEARQLKAKEVFGEFMNSCEK